MHEGFNPEQHVKRMLAAVQAYAKGQPPKWQHFVGFALIYVL
jgi:hypothetical protein